MNRPRFLSMPDYLSLTEEQRDEFNAKYQRQMIEFGRQSLAKLIRMYEPDRSLDLIYGPS